MSNRCRETDAYFFCSINILNNKVLDMIIYNENRHNIFIPSGLGGSFNDCDYRYNEGYAEGYDDGYDEGYADGYEAGLSEKSPMYFMAEEEGCAVSMIHYRGNQPEGLQYLMNGIDWIDWNGEEVPLDMGEKMYVRCTKLNHHTSETNNIYSTFSFAGRVGAYGSVKSMDNYGDIPSRNAFYALFRNSTLTKAPILDYEYATYYCFAYMFLNCVNLIEAPELPMQHSTTDSNGAFMCMLEGCINLTKAPSSINVETLYAQGCYYMFEGCVNLTKAPIIYAKNVGDDGARHMFSSCHKLNELTSYVDEVGTNGWYRWLNSVAPIGVLFNHGTYEYEKDSASGIPTGWIECRDAYNEGEFYALNTGVAFENEASWKSMPYLYKDNNRLTYVMKKDDSKVNYMASDDAYNTILNGYYCSPKATTVIVEANRVEGVQYRLTVVDTSDSGLNRHVSSNWHNLPSSGDISFRYSLSATTEHQILVEFKMADGSNMTRDIAERLNTQVYYTFNDMSPMSLE